MGRPSEEFTIHILSNEEYDNLPYPNAKTSYGMAVMDKKTAYVRQTNVREMDIGTINHEFDELLQEVSPHEENGIRYKSSKGVVGQLVALAASFIPGVGPILGPAISLATMPKPKQPNYNFVPAQATSAFAPQPAQASAPTPLSELDFNTGLSNIDKNRQKQQASIFSMFRGQGSPNQNTAFSKALSNVDTSYQTSREQFIKDQEERKKLAGM